MRFLSIYKTAEKFQPPSQDEIEKMSKLIEEMSEAGVLVSTEGCLPSTNGARVRLTGGKLTVTDGPFTETKEQVAGFALLQTNSLREAIESTKTFLKVVGSGECEVRQLYETPGA
jgi:hypothetical protein